MNLDGIGAPDTSTDPAVSALEFKTWAATVLLAISLQILTTIEVGGSELRFGISDLLLPVLVPLVVWKWLRDDRVFPDWRVPHFWVWLGVLTFWIGFSIVNGRLYMGQWQSWAILNKGVGWLVLLGYLLLGGWFAAFFDIRLRRLFVKALLLSTWIICGYGLIRYFLFFHGKTLGIEVWTGAWNYFRITGFFDNPNALGIFVAAMIVLQVALSNRERLASPLIANLGMGAALLTIVFAGSRSALLGLAVAMPIILLMDRRRIRQVLRGVLTASILGVVLLYSPMLAMLGSAPPELADIGTKPDAGPVFKAPYLIKEEMVQAKGVRQRVASTVKALEMWRDNPIIGVGLGSYRHGIEGRTDIAITIHNSFLWLLAETGLVGALLFSAFFAIVLLCLYRGSRQPEADPLIAGVFGVLLVFAGASMGTEIMYQRYFWFLIGLAICLPPSPSAGATSGHAVPRRIGSSNSFDG